MRRVVILILVLTSSVMVYAQDEQQLLRRVADYVAKMGSYDAEVDITAGEYRSSGSYSVAGDTYHINIGTAELFADGKTRYEINHERKEVSVDVVDLESRNILDNPTRCFDFVGEEYVAEVESINGDVVTLRMVARNEQDEGEILLSAAKTTGKPLRISYILYDDRIDVEIKSLTVRKSKIPTFSKGDFRGYDMVDFR